MLDDCLLSLVCHVQFVCCVDYAIMYYLLNKLNDDDDEVRYLVVIEHGQLMASLLGYVTYMQRLN